MKKKLPRATDPHLAWMVREPFPSVSTGVGLDFGLLPADARLVLHSEMAEGGAIFADGIESDALEFLGGHCVTVRRADKALHLVVPVRTTEKNDPPG